MTAQRAVPALCRDLGIRIDQRQLLVSSVDVAKRFGRRHDHALRDIDQLLEVSPNLGRSNWFRPREYIDAQQRVQRAFDLTRDGFVLLVMGWTGPKALEFKIGYIEAFNAMEAALRTGGVDRPLSRTKTQFKAEELLTGWNEEAIAGGLPGLQERSLFTRRAAQIVSEHPEMLQAIAAWFLHWCYQEKLKRALRSAQSFDDLLLPGFIGPVRVPNLYVVIRDGAEKAVPRSDLTYAEKAAFLGRRSRQRRGFRRFDDTTLHQDRALVAEHNTAHPDQPFTTAILTAIAPDLLPPDEG